MRKARETSTRLEQARAALAVVENRQGIRAFHQRFHSSEIRPGVYEVGAGMSALAAVLRELFVRPAWVAFVGASNVGWEAASQVGWDLSRIVLVQCESALNAKVLAALLEGFDVVVTDGLKLSPSQQQTLAGKARQLNRVVLTRAAWPTYSIPIVPREDGLRYAR